MRPFTIDKAIYGVIALTLIAFILSYFDVSILLKGLKAIAFWILFPLTFMLLAFIVVSINKFLKKKSNKIKR
ncbi:hypothetical protein MUK51_10825 [Sphingobacterium faecium]|uniref:hypothetical protein n=1 Tax=Sphingobacterium faecium TaxID=34087 RepID=UPI0021B5647B|nr:hypothetical protein [Sphingobacterium faecium]UXD67724.1 hypothetical protein MUK51_10825 [Sphingobacterium faecium]